MCTVISVDRRGVPGGQQISRPDFSKIDVRPSIKIKFGCKNVYDNFNILGTMVLSLLNFTVQLVENRVERSSATGAEST